MKLSPAGSNSKQRVLKFSIKHATLHKNAQLLMNVEFLFKITS